VVRNARAVPGPDLITAATLTREANFLNGTEDGEILALKQQIREDPQDPYLHYQLGVAYMNANRPQLAREAFQKAYQLAEGNPEIILELGQLLSEIDLWTYTAYSYLRVEQIGSPIPAEELQMRIREALFYAAYEFISVEVLSENPDVVIEPALEQLMKARRALQSGKVTRASEIVDRILAERPDLLEAYLIKIDILYAQERYEEAASLLVELQGREDLPEWIRRASGEETEQY